jgi:hypothetical protein
MAYCFLEAEAVVVVVHSEGRTRTLLVMVEGLVEVAFQQHGHRVVDALHLQQIQGLEWEEAEAVEGAPGH